MAGPWEKYAEAPKADGPWAKYAAPQADPVKDAIDRSPTAGLLDAGLALASGTVAAPVAGFAGLAQGAKNLVAGDGMPAGDRVRQVQNAITYEPRTKIGSGLTAAVSYPFEKLAELGDAAGARTAEETKMPAAGAAVNTAFQALPLVIGRVKPGAKPAPKALNTAVETAREADIAVPPSQANPTIWNKIVEGFAGKIKTAQDLSLKNQPKYNDMIREGLGLEKAPRSIRRRWPVCERKQDRRMSPFDLLGVLLLILLTVKLSIRLLLRLSELPRTFRMLRARTSSMLSKLRSATRSTPHRL
jgi:hypothetical protein